MKPSEVVSKAIDILNTRGWCQRDYENEDGALCVVGAINYIVYDGVLDAYGAFGTDAERYEVKNAIVNKITDRVDDSPIYWNDAPNRTAKEVVAVLKDVQTAFESEGK